jgi:hypothetical protein
VEIIREKVELAIVATTISAREISVMILIGIEKSGRSFEKESESVCECGRGG